MRTLTDEELEKFRDFREHGNEHLVNDNHRTLSPFTDNFETMVTLMRILTEEIDFHKPFRIVIDYDPEQPRVPIHFYANPSEGNSDPEITGEHVDNTEEYRWEQIQIPRDCVTLYVGNKDGVEKYWERREGRKITLLSHPSRYGIPGVIIGYAPGTEDQREWESLNPPVLARAVPDHAAALATCKGKTKKNADMVINELETALPVFKRFPKHLMERSGLLRYANAEGTTTITIRYNADTEEGTMEAVTEHPIRLYPPDSYLSGKQDDPTQSSQS